MTPPSNSSPIQGETVSIWVCAKGECDPVMASGRTCRCRREYAPGRFVYADRVPVEYVPALQLREVEAKLRKAREALKWYANQNRYRVGKWPERDDDPAYDGSIFPDSGKRARAALASIGGEQP